MNQIKSALVMAFISLSFSIMAQDVLTYQTPPKPLADLVNAPVTPNVSVDSKGKWMLIMERSDLPTIAELSQPELRLAGLRMNPATNGASRQQYINNFKLRKLGDKTDIAVKNLPNSTTPQYGSISWSPDETKIAFTQTSDNKIEAYIIDVATATASKLTDLALNAITGSPISWLSDSKSLLIKAIPSSRGNAPVISRTPVGPTIQENLGKKAEAPTFQDLLKNPSDEKQFEYYTTSQIIKVSLTGETKNIGSSGIILSVRPSPDGKYVMIQTLHRPFSYLVTLNNFPRKVDIYDSSGGFVKTMVDNPLNENSARERDATSPYPRAYDWRDDVAATMVWVEAQDGGNPKTKIAFRDNVLTLDAPFSGSPKVFYSSKLRFSGITWGTDKMALVNERWWQNRKEVTQVVNPSNPTEGYVLFDRSSEDRYGDPGDPELTKNQYGRYVLDINKNNEILMTGTGASAEGDRPFVDVLNLKTKESKRLWRSEAPYFERPISVINAEKGLILTTREAQEENPNYFIRNIYAKKGENPLTQITSFPHPYPQLKGVQKQLLRYKRTDGVDLNATLYLPAGYKKEDGPLPTFLWAYPTEYKSKDAASQVTGSPYTFNRISYWGAAAFVTMGYAILDNASIPIVGEGDKEPNDTYVEQLVGGAKAAIDEGVRLGVVDASRVGVGGHSYGAFMTANLLTHSNLFKAGIARSGAYNRTLTPYGFQAEERTYWQAPSVYNTMSPFMNADKMKTPLLLTHGEADNNKGTFPLQSERYYNALKGMGATVRFVLLPYESHGYTAKESLLHMLYEMDGWLDKYVKKGKKLP